MSKDDKIVLDGIVMETLPGALFSVQLANGHQIKATLGGKLKQHSIRVLLGDPVEVELSPYDVTQGRIVFRGKRKPKEPTPEEEQSTEDSN